MGWAISIALLKIGGLFPDAGWWIAVAPSIVWHVFQVASLLALLGWIASEDWDRARE